MIIAKTREELDIVISSWKAQGIKTGFVPTMGALHEGHLSLCKTATKHCDKLVVSIFVNPTQFAPDEDLQSYPRTLETDIQKLKVQGLSHLVYAPRISDIYPDEYKESQIVPGDAAQGLESDFRPHFFDGVCNVVQRLFDQVKPDISVFGEKDYQQLMVIRQMVATHAMPIKILAGDTKRDEFGLALSSRNAYLSMAELEIARMLNQVLYGLAHGIGEGINVKKACENAASMLLEAGFDTIDYVAYKPEWNRVLIAAWLGKTRLIDNCAIPKIQKSPPKGELLKLT